MLLVPFIIHLIASNILKVQAISCYLCESVYAIRCGEDFELDEAFKSDCAQVPPPRYLANDLFMTNATACMKKIFSEHGEQKIVRSCYFGDVNDTSIGCRTDPALTATVNEISCHVCANEDFCNAATTIRSSPSLLFSAKPTMELIMKLLNTLISLAIAYIL